MSLGESLNSWARGRRSIYSHYAMSQEAAYEGHDLEIIAESKRPSASPVKVSSEEAFIGRNALRFKLADKLFHTSRPTQTV